MTKKAEFNAEEWAHVTEGPAVAGMIVITSQKGGTIRESLSMGKAYAEARGSHEGPELIGELLSSNPSVNPADYKTPEELRTGGLQRIRDAVALLETKAQPDEVEAYREFVIAVAQRAAEADKSGGFLGVGGKKVSDNEAAALGEIREALGTPPAA
jgi:hypothetical protein